MRSRAVPFAVLLEHDLLLLVAERKAIADALKIISIWNARQAGETC
jgi:hypothetical protein